MDSRVVHSQVNENDEHHPHNIDSQQGVSPGAEEHNSDHDSKSTVFMNKVKARAKKIRNTIKNIGHHSPRDADLVEDKEIVEDHEEDAPATPVYDTEAVKSATPAPEKEKNSVASEVDLGGTKDTGDGEDLHDHDQLVKGHSSTNEINQNIASEKPRVLEKDLQEQESRPEAHNRPNYQTEVSDQSGLAYDSEDVKNAALVSKTVEDLKKSEIDYEGTRVKGDKPHHDSLVEGLSSTNEINQDIATEKPRVLEKDLHELGSRPEAYNLPNYQTEVTDPSGLAYDSEAVKSATPASEKVEDSRKSEIDFEGFTIKGNEPHHDPLVEDSSSTTEINQNIATEKPIVFENDPPQQGSILESYDLPNHQTKITDPSGKGSDETNDITKVEDSFERLNVQDEPKQFIEPKTQSNFAENEYPLAGRNDLFDPQTKTQYEPAKEETFNTITNTAERQPSYEPVETQPQHKDETEILSATGRETFSPQNNEASKLAHDVKETHDDYDKVMVELKEEVPETSTADVVVTETKNEDKDHATARETFSPQNNEASKLAHDVKETHDDYEKVMVELKEEVPETSTADVVVTETKNEDKDHATARETFYTQNDEASKLDHDVKQTHDDYEKVMVELKEEVPETNTSGDVGTETKNEDKDHAKGVPVKDYLAEKLRPGEDDKALSEVISETLHKKKEEPVKKEDVQFASGDEKSEKVSEEPNVESPGKGYVDRFKDAVGSWFYTSEEKQSPQVAGDEDLLKNKDSVVEGERVSQVKGE